MEEVQVQKVAIEEEGDKSSGSSAVAIEKFEKAETALEAAQGASGDVEALESLKGECENLQDEADTAVVVAEDALAKTVELKEALMAAKDTLPMYIQAAEEAKAKAEAAYDVAKTHTATPTQRAAEEKARNAWEAAKDHCAHAKDLLASAEDMVSKADNAISLASASLYVAQ